MSNSIIRNENSNVVHISHARSKKQKVSCAGIPSWLVADLYIKARMTEIGLLQIRLGNEEVDLSDLDYTGTH